MNGYPRRWIDGAGTGIVFETNDGGSSWSDLPDAPGDALVVLHGKLVLPTDIGVFAAGGALGAFSQERVRPTHPG